MATLYFYVVQLQAAHGTGMLLMHAHWLLAAIALIIAMFDCFNILNNPKMAPSFAVTSDCYPGDIY